MSSRSSIYLGRRLDSPYSPSIYVPPSAPPALAFEASTSQQG
ncbi:hypothetical protein ACP70R_028866 [Stipagrostis hirtigluma subsp. patula]